VTVNPKGEIERFTGILIGSDGRIRAVLHRGEPRPRAETTIDAKGQNALPGLIDAHAHVMELGFAALTLDLMGTQTLAEGLEATRAYVAAHPGGGWVQGWGWNQERWGLRDEKGRSRFPTAAELDAVAGGRAVWLRRADGHAGWASSRALELAGITKDTPDPAGGRIERLPDGRPSGVLVDNAVALVDKAVPAPRPEDRDLALATAQKVLLAKGVTAVADMGSSIEDWQAYRRAGDYGTLRIRIMAYAHGIENMVLIGGPGPGPWLYEDHLRLDGVKLYADGALGSRGALLKAPYADAPGQTGLAITPKTALKNMMSRAALDHFQVAVHAIGDKANAEVLDAIEAMAPTYPGDRRWRIEHAQILDPADLPRFAKLGVVASMQPVHQSSDRLMAEARLGPARLKGAYAWKSLSDTGAKLAFGSDAPVEASDPFAGIATAISRTGPDGQPFGGWQAQERVSREQALAAYTAGAAWAGFAEGRFGRIAVGERADFVLVDRDVMLASPSEIRATRVLEAWVGGRKVWAPGGN
jgi:predicted amidohydrolase YtcJ